MGKIAVVVISGATREFDREYHYIVPEEFSGSLEAGMRVIVPFGKGNRPKEGYVIGFAANKEFDGLKEIKKVVDKKPVLLPSQIDLAAWMKRRYFCTYSQAFRCMLPPGIDVRSLQVVELARGVVRTGSGGFADDGGSAVESCCAHDGGILTDDNCAVQGGSNNGCGQGTGLNDEVYNALPPNKKLLIDLIRSNDGSIEYDELKKLYGRKSNFGRNLEEMADQGLVRITEQYSSVVRTKTVRAACLAMPAEEVASDMETGVIKKIQQIRVLEMLLENEYIAVQDIMRFAGVSASVLDTLSKYGYISYVDLEVKRDPLRRRKVEPTVPMVPTREQKTVLDNIKALIDTGKFYEVLLHGVTGSGKTEVYLQLIQHVLDRGRQAIVLVPEISLTPQMVDRFRGRFGDLVAVIHSRLSPGERYDQWRLIRDGKVKVVVGARSAIFAPFDKPGLVIIDEEHETTYKSETTPKYHAAQIAAKRCMHSGGVLIYGSATPSVGTYQRALDGRIGLAVMKERANEMVMPGVVMVDMRKELELGNKTIFSTLLSAEIEKNIANGQQTILFLNKRGYASFVLCRNCGIRLKCRHCSITMTYHSTDDRLICHYCGYTVKMPSVCPKCGSSQIRQFGTGTQKVEEELHKYFPGASVIRMDMDTTTGKRSHEEILDTFRKENINILIGTQMIAKGHDFPNVTLVGVLAADSMLGIDDFRASERTFQLLTQVAGRAGRGSMPGRVVIQTYSTEDYSLTAASRHDYEAFFRQEQQIRKRLCYPPFTHIALVVVSSVNDRIALSKAKDAYDFLAAGFDTGAGDELLPGPVRAPMARLRNRYRWRVVAKCGSLSRLSSILSSLTDHFMKNRGRSDVDISIDIDPTSMM